MWYLMGSTDGKSSAKVDGFTRTSNRFFKRNWHHYTWLITVIMVVLVSLSDGKVTKKSGNGLTIATPDQKTVTTATPSTIGSRKLRYQATKVKSMATQQQRAIIAIEIVDPNDNSTKKRNGKRTIDSSLGYGYQPSNYFPVSHKPPKYEVYKYSQEDIPPYRVSNNFYTGDSSHIEVQKSIRYDLGSTQPELVPHRYYSPGTILYTNLDQQGNIGGLSQRVPSNQHTDAMVPVIILRVFTNQLTRPGTLHPNLPHSHPYAALNDIDLQSLLSGYVPPDYRPERYHHQYHQHTELPTHENYPDDLHTKVIFHQRGGGTAEYPNRYHYGTGPKEIRVHVPENVYSSIQVQEDEVVPPNHEQISQQMEQNDGAGGYYYYPPGDGAVGQDYQVDSQRQQSGEDDQSERYEYVVPQQYYESGSGGAERVEDGDQAGKVYNYHAHAHGQVGARDGKKKRRVGGGNGKGGAGDE